MSFPFGETGSGKMGLRSPRSQELRTKARPASPMVVISARALRATRWKYIGGRNRTPAVPWTADPIESKIDCGRSPEASLRRPGQPQPVRRMPQLRAADGALRRPLPQLRLQALALHRDGVRGFQSVAAR